MGNHDLGRAIGQVAQIAFERRKPDETALQILDRICQERGGDAEFEAEDPNRPGHTHPDFLDYRDPNPKAGLGILMVEAFAPNGLADLPKYAGVMGYWPSKDAAEDERRATEAEASADLWREEVCKPFDERYGFW